MFRANNFDKLLDKATSNLRLDPDWPTILQICDLIRQNDCSPKYAVAAVKKKLYSQNPHQAMFALLTLESIVKNCGSGVHDEVTSKPFCEMLRDLVKTTQHENLRNKILELTQAWAFAFRNNPKYRAVQDTVNILKAETYKFPPLKESDAMFSADTAPEWADGEVCHRCRVAFSLMVRRHHCRACGQVFCQQCSSKTSTLPKFGIEKEVRVCDACFDKVSRPPPANAKLEIVDTSSDYGPTQSTQKPPGKSAEELQEEEELQLALALSQSEAEHKEKEKKSRSYIAPDPASLHPTVSPSPSSVSASPEHSAQANTELSRYLDRNYWEQRVSRDTAAPTAPSSQSTQEVAEQEYTKPNASKTQDDDAEDKEIDEFVETLKSQVEIFVNRMKSNSSRGRSIANDTSVQTLFMNITTMHSRLLRYIQQQDDKRVYLESLQDKVSQVRDSRAALDTLRAEHAARRVAEAEAAERQRQQQMAAKLHAMRKKKHEYLQYQRQLALQRVQEQEREMQMRQEQQKHQYMMSANSYFMPGVSLHQYQQGYPNPIYANPQFHSQIPQATTDASMPMQGQPQMSQANMTMGSQMAQAMPSVTSTFAMHTPGPAVSQATANAPLNQPNIRPNISQIQQQMMMQQMQHMRMPAQQGLPQMLPQNMVNGFPGQNIPQQNGQTIQLPKQNLPNQPQVSNMMPATSIGQQPNQPMLGAHMQNMRMPLIQGNQPNNQQVPVSAYTVNSQNQQNIQQSALQIPNMQSQVPLPGQQGMQGPNQSISLPSHIPASGQSVSLQGPHSQGQQVSQQSQQMNKMINQPMPISQPMHIPGQQMNMQGLQMQAQGQNIPQHHLMNQGQQLPGQSGQHMLQGQQFPYGQAMSHAQHIPNQIQPGQVPQQLPHPQASQIQGPPTHQLNQGQPLQQMPQNPQMGQSQNPSGQQQMLQGQHLPQGQMPQSQQLPMGQQMVQGQQMIQGQQMGQGQQIQQGQQMPQNAQGQTIKIQQQSVNVQPQSIPNQQPPAKTEHNNNTSELISFD